MHEQTAPNMHTEAGKKVALKSVSVEVVLRNLLCETSMTQVYRNLENRPIEAVYTFPLSSQAVLLSLTIFIGGRKLQGIVVGKAKAEERYEDAISDGDAAVMLEQVEPGLYTMNVGNILAGEEVSISIIYAELFSWEGDTLRFHLPTTIAPRYGNPEEAGLQPHQTPEYDLLAENRFQFKLTIMGALADAELDSPSHLVAISRTKGNAVVTLATGETFMDRDFIVNIRSAHATKDSVLIDRDLGNGYVALASFAPCLPAFNETVPRSIKILVDCSGSMAGDSITQARQALNDILNQLRPEDHFNIVTFGSTFKLFFHNQEPANKKNITKVRRFLRNLAADMGGTEIRKALHAAIHIKGPPIPQDILLITDGEVWNGDEIIHEAMNSNHRIFTVGVGSSVSEKFVRQLAKETRGACELVAPCENMAEKIVRHFKRIYLPRAGQVVVHWPKLPKRAAPSDISSVYDGDTLHVFAFFGEKPVGQVVLSMTLADGQTLQTAINLPDQNDTIDTDGLPSNLARMAIHGAMIDVTEKEALNFALEYQLICPFTKYLVVAERVNDEKAKNLPVLRKVPQMLAAGWGGSGRVMEQTAPKFRKRLSISQNRPHFLDVDEIDMPTFIRRNETADSDVDFLSLSISSPSPDDLYSLKQHTSPAMFIHNCSKLHSAWLLPVLRLKNYRDLESCKLPKRILQALEAIIKEQYKQEVSEVMFVLTFLNALLQSPIGSEFTHNTRQAIEKTFKTLHPDKRLSSLMIETVAFITADDWGIAEPSAEQAAQEVADCA